MRSRRPSALLALLPALLLPTDALPEWQGGSPGMEQRVAAQRAIEEVYWRHRIWPGENPGPKPPLDAVMPEAAIRAKVLDYVKKSVALERFWQRPITAAELQAEIDRMSRDTRDAALLYELYEALGNDPQLIAETLARHTLSERLVRSWYAHDERVHGDLRRRAERALAGLPGIAAMPDLGGEYEEVTYVSLDEDAAAVPHPGSVPLAPDEWVAWTEEIAGFFGVGAAETPLLLPSGLQEDEQRFFAVAVLTKTAEEITVATVNWPKPPFDSWWAVERAGLVADIRPERGSFTLSAPEDNPCTDDSWQEMWAVPDPRTYRFTAVWTGTEMIVWGGREEAVSFNTGGRYDPATDSWTKVSTEDAPTGRYRHTAVWTGSEMVVWGGSVLPGGGELSTGGRYTPAMDSWASTSIDGPSLPDARNDHTAVWTGSEMIVWGGLIAPGVPVSTGGRYRPATDSWVAPPSRPVGPLSRTLAATTRPSGREA